MHTLNGPNSFLFNYHYLALTTPYITSNFRVRFRAQKDANTANAFDPFFLEAYIKIVPCTDVMKIGNEVFMDANFNGVKDAGEQVLQEFLYK